jgi:hypothetical protein
VYQTYDRTFRRSVRSIERLSTKVAVTADIGALGSVAQDEPVFYEMAFDRSIRDDGRAPKHR